MSRDLTDAGMLINLAPTFRAHQKPFVNCMNRYKSSLISNPGSSADSSETAATTEPVEVSTLPLLVASRESQLANYIAVVEHLKSLESTSGDQGAVKNNSVIGELLAVMCQDL